MPTHSPTPPPASSPRPGARTSIAGGSSEVEVELDAFDHAIDRFLAGKIPESSFLEYRLRHGVYGQRQDGVHMIRSKLPLGLLSPDQLDAFADLTEAYTAGVAHLTTRQDIQVHFVPLQKTPDLMRVLASAEMTSREACGNVVRNVCASEAAGVLPDEAFDVTPHGMALAQFLLRHPDGQSLGRKFKVTLSGSFDPFFNLGPIHDIGATAVLDGDRRGFHVVVGGGLGAVPHEAKLFSEFVDERELLPISLAILRVFAKHGEKKKRSKARLKFLVAQWGIERFIHEVELERSRLDEEGRDLGQSLLDLHLDGRWSDVPRFAASSEFPTTDDADAAAWLRSNVLRQSQPGYAAVRVRVPQGDLTPGQLRGLAELLRAHTGDTLRIAADQSLLIRFVPFDRLLALRDELTALGLGKARAGGLGDTVTCPGADSCKLGITSPKAVARHIEPLLDRLAEEPRLEKLRIKISGCPNSCAQHHVADIGMFGAARTSEGRVAPHYMLHVGGVAGGHRALPDTPGYGVNIARVPGLRVGEVIERLATTYLADAAAHESWAHWVHRFGRKQLQSLVADLTALPTPDARPEFFNKVGQSEAFEVVRGTGECAGEVVLAADLLLIEADQRTEKAASLLDGAQAKEHATREIQSASLEAMTFAARALLSTQHHDAEQRNDVVARFKERFYDPGKIYEAVGGYFIAAVEESDASIQTDRLRRLVVEAGLFVEEAHTIIAKMQAPETRVRPVVQLGKKAVPVEAVR